MAFEYNLKFKLVGLESQTASLLILEHEHNSDDTNKLEVSEREIIYIKAV